MQTCKSFFFISGLFVVLLLLSAGLYAAWPTFVQAANLMVKVCTAILILALPAAFGLGVWFVVSEIQLREQRKQRFVPSEQGYYEAYLTLDDDGQPSFTKPQDNIPLQVPHTYSPRLQISGSPQEIENRAAGLTITHAPSLQTIIQELSPNTLEFIYGINPETEELVKTRLLEAVHLQLIGSIGMGKSHQAISILTQLVTKNDPKHLTLALLDIEKRTTEPFQSLPQVKYLATDRKEAAHILRQLVLELERREERKQLSPIILVVVEEFLRLRRTMPADYRDQALEDFTTLAIGGRKVGIFLLTLGQTAYAEKAIRDAQLQFLSSMAFAIRPSAARSAGFMNTPLLNRLYSERKPGQFLLERPTGDSLLLAPYVDAGTVCTLLGTSRGSSWGTSSPASLPDTGDLPTPPGLKPDEVVRTTHTFSVQERQIVDCLSRGLTINQIMAEVYAIEKPGSDYQKKLPELRAAMQRIAQFTREQINA